MNGLAFRSATLDDAAFAADTWTAARPTFPVDPVILRGEWEASSWPAQRFVVARGGRRVGIAYFEHPRWELTEVKFAIIGGDLFPAERGHLSAVLERMEARAREAGATVLRAFADESDPTRVEVLLGRGFREDRRGRRWELDLVANRERLLAMTEGCRERMRRERIRLLTLASDPDPKKYEKFWRMSEEAALDVPTTFPHVPESLDDYMRWLREPGMHEDRFWLARMDDDVVGASVLTYPPVRGIVGTAWTATARSVRGRGVARALKCETVAQAIALGVDRVRTGNDSKNDPILHINETMGYRPIPGAIHFQKDAC